MRFFRHSHRKPSEEVIFAGERMEAELVVNLLREEGFHPLLWADLPAPAYAGPLGMARVVVPPEEAEEAKTLLENLEELAAGEEPAEEENGGAAGEVGGAEPEPSG